MPTINIKEIDICGDSESDIESDTSSDSELEVQELFKKFNKIEKIPLKDFLTAINFGINEAQQIKEVIDFLTPVLFKERKKPRFTNKDSLHFQTAVDAIAAYIEDEKQYPVLRTRLACLLAEVYDASINIKEIFLNDFWLRGALKWRSYIIEREGELGIHDPERYLASCQYICDLYQKHAQQTFVEFSLDATHPEIKLAINYLLKGVALVEKSGMIDYAKGNNFFKKCIAFQHQYLPPHAILTDQCVQNLIKTLERLIEYATDPPSKKYVTYVTPSIIKQETELAYVRWRARQSQSPHDMIEVGELSQVIEKMSTKGLRMWDLDEKNKSYRDADEARMKLGWLYFRVHQAPDLPPSYEKAAQWFLSCVDKKSSEVQEVFALPEIQRLTFRNICGQSPK